MKFYTFSLVAAPSLAFVIHHMNLLWTGNWYYYVFHFVLLRVFIIFKRHYDRVQSPIFYIGFFCEFHVQHPPSGTLHKSEAYTRTQTDMFAYINRSDFAQQHRIQSACLWFMWYFQRLLCSQALYTQIIRTRFVFEPSLPSGSGFQTYIRRDVVQPFIFSVAPYHICMRINRNAFV